MQIREEINCNSLWNRKRQFSYYAAIKEKKVLSVLKVEETQINV